MWLKQGRRVFLTGISMIVKGFMDWVFIIYLAGIGVLELVIFFILKNQKPNHWKGS
jgi:hypothetical protein